MTGSPSVLLVNHFTDEREMYVEGLRAYGYRPLSATSAEDAYRVLEETEPTIVVTDVPLGGPSNGFDLTRRLKSQERTREVPVIVLTGRVGEAERKAAQDAGCDLFLEKPCLAGKLAREIRLLLDRSRELRERSSRHQVRALNAREQADRALNHSKAIARSIRGRQAAKRR